MFTLDTHVDYYKTQLKPFNWGQYDSKLKYHFRKENPVTTYKLSKEELDEYLKIKGYK